MFGDQKMFQYSFFGNTRRWEKIREVHGIVGAAWDILKGDEWLTEI